MHARIQKKEFAYTLADQKTESINFHLWLTRCTIVYRHLLLARMVVCEKCFAPVSTKNFGFHREFMSNANGEKWLRDYKWCKKCIDREPPPKNCQAFQGKFCANRIAVIILSSKTNESRWACFECASSEHAMRAGFDIIDG